MKCSFNMISTCVSRDLFGFKHEDKGWEISRAEDMEVGKYVNFSSPILYGKKGCDIRKDKFDDAMASYCREFPNQFSKFRWRCKYMDIARKGMDYIKEETSDYFIIDNYALRYNFLELENGVVVTDFQRPIIEYLARHHVIPPIKRRIAVRDIPRNEIEDGIREFSKMVQEVYPASKIILIGVKESQFYIKDGSAYPFEDRSIKSNNAHLEMYLEILKKYFPGCHLVNPDILYLGNFYHQWGPAPVHYVDEIYRCYIERIRCIVHGDSLNEDTARRLDNAFHSRIKEQYFMSFYHALLQRNDPLEVGRCFRFKTFRGDYLFFDSLQKKLVHLPYGKYMEHPVYGFIEGQELFLYFLANHLANYIRLSGNECSISQIQVPNKFCRNQNKTISIQNDRKEFLSTREDHQFSFMKWNRAWEQFSLEEG